MRPACIKTRKSKRARRTLTPYAHYEPIAGLEPATHALRMRCSTSRTRTGDPRITNALLYQLSHIGKLKERSCSKADAKTVQIECRELALMPRRSPFSQFDCKDTTKIPFSKIFDYNFITLILILQQSGGTDTAQRLGSHLQITGDIDQRCTEHELRTALHELGITVLRRLEAQHVSMDL